jgi:rRNA-processing protein FCF1
MASNRVRGDRKIRYVILDTNAILMCFEFSIDLENEIFSLIGNSHIIVPEPIYEELKILSTKGKGNKRIKAKGAIDLIKKYDIVSLDYNLSADTAIFKYAKDLNAFVVTNDKELRKKLKNESISVIYLRGKQKLVLD